MSKPKKDMNQILIEAAIHGSMRDLSRAPERTIRNLVDLALNFSNGRFQRNFLANAQTMLKNKKSAYYDLLRNAIADVDHDTLATFGLNVGYNGCTKGGKKIRAIKEEEHFAVPWLMSFMITKDSWEKHKERYFSAVTEGQRLGTCVYLLYVREELTGLSALLKKHPDCAFVLILNPELVTPPWMDEFETLHNFMVAVNTVGSYPTACELLGNRGFLYALYRHYSIADSHEILNGEWAKAVLPAKASFLFFQPQDEVPLKLRKKVYDYITETRKRQSYPAFLMDLFRDNMLIDEIISGNTRNVTFGEDGLLWVPDVDVRTSENPASETRLCLFEKPIEEILRSALALS